MRTFLVLLAAFFCLGARSDRYDRTDKEDIVKSLLIPDGGSSRQIIVDNINGDISIEGYEGNEVQLKAHRTSYGKSEEKLRQAKEKITLEIKEEPGRLILYVNTPWRCRDGSDFRRMEDPGFDADFDFTLKVPGNTDFALKTVNKGMINVRNMEGAFEVSNVNGGINMSGIAGSGLASTVNGEVSVTFTRNPESRCAFRTVNGSVDITFPNDLSADLRFKTFNGEIYSDFDVSTLPPEILKPERIGRRTVYRGNEYASVRAGKGGPEMFFETLNGDIRILHAHN